MLWRSEIGLCHRFVTGEGDKKCQIQRDILYERSPKFREIRYNTISSVYKRKPKVHIWRLFGPDTPHIVNFKAPNPEKARVTIGTSLLSH